MDRVREENFWLMVVFLSVLLGVVAFVDITTTDLSTDNPYPWIQFFEPEVRSAYTLNSYGEQIFTNCPEL